MGRKKNFFWKPDKGTFTYQLTLFLALFIPLPPYGDTYGASFCPYFCICWCFFLGPPSLKGRQLICDRSLKNWTTWKWCFKSVEKPGNCPKNGNTWKKNCCFSLLWCVKIDFDKFRIWCCVCATINVNEYIYNVYCRCWWMVWDGWVLCKLLILWCTSRLLHTCYMLQSQCNIWYKLFCKKKGTYNASFIFWFTFDKPFTFEKPKSGMKL